MPDDPLDALLPESVVGLQIVAVLLEVEAAVP
jgi:hypothetical protein